MAEKKHCPQCGAELWPKLRATLPHGNPPAVSYTQERKLPHAAAFVRHSSSGGRCPSARNSIASGSQEY